MTKETKDLGAAPPRSLTDAELNAIDAWESGGWIADAAHRAVSELRSARKALRRYEWLPDSAGNLCCPECFGHALHEPACALRALLGSGATAPQAPPDSSAALLEARRLLNEAQEWIDPHMDAGLLGRIRAFLRSDSERSEHGKG